MSFVCISHSSRMQKSRTQKLPGACRLISPGESYIYKAISNRHLLDFYKEFLSVVLKELPYEPLCHRISHHQCFLLNPLKDVDTVFILLSQYGNGFRLGHCEVIVQHFLPFLHRPIWIDPTQEGRNFIRVCVPAPLGIGSSSTVASFCCTNKFRGYREMSCKQFRKCCGNVFTIKWFQGCFKIFRISQKAICNKLRVGQSESGTDKEQSRPIDMLLPQ